MLAAALITGNWVGFRQYFLMKLFGVFLTEMTICYKIHFFFNLSEK